MHYTVCVYECDKLFDNSLLDYIVNKDDSDQSDTKTTLIFRHCKNY